MSRSEPTPGDDPRGESLDATLRAATGLQATARRFLADAGAAVDQTDPAFVPVLRRWLESMLSLQLHSVRLESRLQQFAGIPPHAEHQGLAGGAAGFAPWRQRFEDWFDHHHLPTLYRRVEFVLDPDDEAVSADAVTDLALVADCAGRTLPRLDAVLLTRDGQRGGDVLFFGVLAPWRREGLPAARAAAGYLAALLSENDDW